MSAAETDSASVCRLQIRFDGEGDAFSAHRLSLAALGDALPQLLKALRRVATGPKARRFSTRAKALDLQLESLDEGSVQLHFALVDGERSSDDGRYAADVAGRLLDELEKPRSTFAAVRKFKDNLRRTTAGATYVLRRNDEEIRRVETNTTELPPEPSRTPELLQGEATLHSAGFTEGRQWIKVRMSGSGVLHKLFVEAPEQLEAALERRISGFYVRGVLGQRNRLIAIDSSKPASGASSAQTSALLERWRETLARLAE